MVYAKREFARFFCGGRVGGGDGYIVVGAAVLENDYIYNGPDKRNSSDLYGVAEKNIHQVYFHFKFFSGEKHFTVKRRAVHHAQLIKGCGNIRKVGKESKVKVIKDHI